MSYIGRQLNLPASTVQLTADGAITAGKPVVIKSDGSATIPQEQGIGTEVTFDGTDVADDINIVYDTGNDKVLITYRDGSNSSYGTAVVGTVSGDSISFGTPVVFESANTIRMSTAYDANAGKVLIVYRDGGNSNYGTAIVATISGTSVSFGSAAVFKSAAIDGTDVVYSPDDNFSVIIFGIGSGSYDAYYCSATISGTSVSFGTEGTAHGGSFTNVRAGQSVYDTTNDRIVFAYRDIGESNQGYATVGQINNANSITWGSDVQWSTSGGPDYDIGLCFDSNAGKVVIVYSNQGNNDYGTAVVGTVSGTSISFGTPVVFYSGVNEHTFPAFDSSTNKVGILYKDDANTSVPDPLDCIIGTVSGTTMTFSTSFNVGPRQTGQARRSLVFDPDTNQFVAAYQDYTGGAQTGKARVFNSVTPKNTLSSESFIGFAENDCTDNGLLTVQLGGSVNDKQTGLTAGQTYFVRDDATISTTAGDPSVTAGTAVSATEILVKG